MLSSLLFLKRRAPCLESRIDPFPQVKYRVDTCLFVSDRQSCTQPNTWDYLLWGSTVQAFNREAWGPIFFQKGSVSVFNTKRWRKSIKWMIPNVRIQCMEKTFSVHWKESDVFCHKYDEIRIKRFTVSRCIFTHCFYWFQQMHYFNTTLG
jgi:hypothetical protein